MECAHTVFSKSLRQGRVVTGCGQKEICTISSVPVLGGLVVRLLWVEKFLPGDEVFWRQVKNTCGALGTSQKDLRQ